MCRLRYPNNNLRFVYQIIVLALYSSLGKILSILITSIFLLTSSIMITMTPDFGWLLLVHAFRTPSLMSFFPLTSWFLPSDCSPVLLPLHIYVYHRCLHSGYFFLVSTVPYRRLHLCHCIWCIVPVPILMTMGRISFASLLIPQICPHISSVLS